jgi:DNA topoisomerase-6 subunit B
VQERVAEPNTVSAETLAKGHREIGIAEFFSRNKHLLGFDNKKKALLTTIKEAVDNALDACEEARILPEIIIEVMNISDDRYRIVIEDNGPGIIKKQIPKIFAKLLYGSKFHSLKQTRGQQGIGISAAVMYAQLTTGRPAKITSRVVGKEHAQYYELMLDTKANAPKITKEEEKEWVKDHGTRIEIDLEANYSRGAQSIDAYIKQTAIANPHCTIIYTNPKAEQVIFTRAVEELPEEPAEIKPHPYGIEVGTLMSLLHTSDKQNLLSFFTNELSRVGAGTAKQIFEKAGVSKDSSPHKISRDQAERLIKAISETRIIAPPTDCISPIGSDNLQKGLRKEINAEFYTSVTRSPVVYSGNPFIVEAAIAYGGEISKDETARVLRFANRVPLQYQQSACAITQSIIQTNWKSYGLQQSRGALPVGPLVVMVHIASVWVPFTSESKEAVAHYPEIKKEIKLLLQECGRKLGSYIRKKKRVGEESKKRNFIKLYMPIVSEALRDILELPAGENEPIVEGLQSILEEKRGKLQDVGEKPQENTEYDEETAKFGNLASYTSDDSDDLEE